MLRLLHALRDTVTSLKLTVMLLVLSIVLVLCATLNQVQLGVWGVQTKWFRSFIVWQDIGGRPFPVFPGGFLLGGLLLLNLVASHLYRFKSAWNRSGIILTHAGLILLLVGELVTALYQQEFQMRLHEGETRGYAESPRFVELAIIDVTDPAWDQVVAIPADHLRKPAVIQHPGLPFTVTPLVYHPNSQVQLSAQAPDAPASGADRDLGARLAVRPLPVTYNDKERNLPSVLVELAGTEGPLGRWLLSPWLGAPQRFEHAGRTFTMALRFERAYRPFSLTLLDFTHDRYPGTDIPKNFSSRLRLRDDETKAEREVLIYMNNPLRHQGLTFYQQGFDDNDTTSILQVVRNPGWLIPYIACLMLALGLLVQFGLSLHAFIGRRNARAQSAPAASPALPPRSVVERRLPVIILALGLILLAVSLRPSRPGAPFDLEAFGRLPVLLHGRLKPLDTVARTTLLQMQETQTVRAPAGRLEPIEWFARLVFAPAQADALATFRIIHPEVQTLLHLSPADGAGGRRFSFNQLKPHLLDLEKQARLAGPIEAKQRTPFQNGVLQLYGNLVAYQQLKHSLQDPESADFAADLRAFGRDFDRGVAAVQARENGQPHDEAAATALLHLAGRFQFLADFGRLLVIPPPAGAADPLAWKKLGESLVDSFEDGVVAPTAHRWAALGHAWKHGRPAEFNQLVARHRDSLGADHGPVLVKTGLETRFNAAAPFHTSMLLYLVAFLLAVCSWLRWPGPLGRGALWLLALAAGLTTAGLLTRMWLEGRPPVTNLYSSAVFIGWAAVLLCLALERVHRTAIATAAAGLIGFCTLLIAHHLSLGGDTLEMMRAVLDSNFWLSTHVTVVTIGYSATFVAGALGGLGVVLGRFTRFLTDAIARALADMVYGIVCFATLFSLVGTILGGIWADQSWGRFWGWDPKENGALMIVLWNAVILHCRWGGLVRQRGLMNLAIAGNLITGWSWFGTNLLGIGLHSYGFTERGAFVLGLFMLGQLLLIAVSFLPRHRGPAAAATP